MTPETKLDHGQKHILQLVARDKDSEGWTPVSSVLMPHLRTGIPAELLELENAGDEGAGRARLTPEGQSVLNAMAWL